MPLFHATCIVWDLDEAEAYAEGSLGLPDSAYIEAESEADVADALSNRYGWCVNSLDVRKETDPTILATA